MKRGWDGAANVLGGVVCGLFAWFELLEIRRCGGRAGRDEGERSSSGHAAEIVRRESTTLHLSTYRVEGHADEANKDERKQSLSDRGVDSARMCHRGMLVLCYSTDSSASGSDLRLGRFDDIAVDRDCRGTRIRNTPIW